MKVFGYVANSHYFCSIIHCSVVWVIILMSYIMAKHRVDLIILGVWTLIFASTPLSLYYTSITMHQAIDWGGLMESWVSAAGFLVLFLLHHYLIVPRFAHGRNPWKYAICTISCLLAFALFVKIVDQRWHGHHIAQMDRAETVHHMRHPKRHRPQTFPFLPPPVMAKIMMGVLMTGADLGIIAWIRQQEIQRELLMREQQNIRRELEQLRYQINPHFFMNTLNNIHALIAIDQERAQQAVVELSRLMRYALYEGDKGMVPLSQEIDFLEQYISLMKLRYSNKVSIEWHVASDITPSATIPPLLLGTFLENAFKHGISYRSSSFIHVEIRTNNEGILFVCRNSRPNPMALPHDELQGGIGIANVRKRLDLIYTDRYQLDIDDQSEDSYSVRLYLPLTA